MSIVFTRHLDDKHDEISAIRETISRESEDRSLELIAIAIDLKALLIAIERGGCGVPVAKTALESAIAGVLKIADDA